MKRLFYKCISPVRKLYWFLVRPKTRGVKCLLKYQDKVLMVRNTYGRQHWTFPGGGVRRSEKPDEAVRREVSEEVGVRVASLVYLGTYESRREYKRDTVYCYSSQVVTPQLTIDTGEILEARWFEKTNLPQPQSSAVEKVLTLFASKIRNQT